MINCDRCKRALIYDAVYHTQPWEEDQQSPPTVLCARCSPIAMKIVDMKDDDPQLELHGLASTFITAYVEASGAKVRLEGIMAGLRAIRTSLQQESTT